MLRPKWVDRETVQVVDRPTIFGTLFESFLDPEKRAQIGALYTDPDKIMKIVDPVIVRPLSGTLRSTQLSVTTKIEWELRGRRLGGLIFDPNSRCPDA